MMARAKTILLIVALVCAVAPFCMGAELTEHWTFDGYTSNSHLTAVTTNTAASTYEAADMVTTAGPTATSIYDFHEAIVFDGVDDYFRIPEDSGMNVGAGSFSVSFWWKGVRTGLTNRHIISKGSLSTSTAPPNDRHHYDFKLHNTPGRLYFACDDAALQVADPTKRDNGAKKQGYSDPDTTPTLPFLNNEWHHVVVVRDATVTSTSSGTLRLYIDGSEEMRSSEDVNNDGTFPRHYGFSGNQNGNLDQPGTMFNIGAGFKADGTMHENPAPYGAMDDLRVYRGALTQQEIFYMYQPTPTPSPAQARRWEIYE